MYVCTYKPCVYVYLSIYIYIYIYTDSTKYCIMAQHSLQVFSNPTTPFTKHPYSNPCSTLVALSLPSPCPSPSSTLIVALSLRVTLEPKPRQAMPNHGFLQSLALLQSDAWLACFRVSGFRVSGSELWDDADRPLGFVVWTIASIGKCESLF